MPSLIITYISIFTETSCQVLSADLNPAGSYISCFFFFCYIFDYYFILRGTRTVSLCENLIPQQWFWRS